MALTIAIEGTGIIANCDAISDTAGGTWFELGGGSISLSNDVYLVGGASIGGQYASKSGIHAIDKGSALYDFTSGGAQEGEHLYIWVAATAIGTLDTLANYGLCIRLSSGSSSTASSNYVDFLIAGNNGANGWTGGWQCFVLDPTKTPTRSNGTVATILANVRSIGLWIDCSTSARADSFFVGGIAIGNGLRITGTSTTGWKDTVDYCTDYANRGWGMFQEREGIYYAYGKIYIGDSTSQAANVSFVDSGRVIQFGTSEYYNGSAWVTSMDAASNGIVIEDHSSYTTTFQDGVLVGTENGRAGTSFLGNSLSNVSMDLYGGNNAASLTLLYGTRFKDLTGTLNSGNDAQHKFLGVSFAGCSQFDPVGAPIVRNCIFAETVSTDSALLWNDSIDISDCSFIANTIGAGIEHTVVTGNPYTYDTLTFSSNTYDVLNSSSGELQIENQDSNTSSSENTGGGSVSITTSVSINVNVKNEAGTNIAGALVYIDEDLEVAGNITNTTTDANGNITQATYSGAATTATVRVRKYGYKQNTGTISLATNSSTNVILIADPQQT